MTFKEIVDFALAECGYDNSTASSTPRTRMKARVNQWQRRILARPGHQVLLRTAHSYSFASVADQAVYGLPSGLGRVDAIRETDNDRRLELRTLDWLRLNDPGLTASGTPFVYVPRGWYPVQLQPSNASTIAIKSTSASDTAVARIEYLNASGQRLIANVTMTGTSAANLATSVVEITQLYLASAAVGTVSIYEDSDAGTVLGVIPVGYTATKFLHIQLWPTPTGAITYYVDLTRELADMIQDKEEPLIPPDFHHLLWRGAVCDEWLLKDDDRYQIVRQDFEEELKYLNSWVWNHVDYLPTPQDDRPKFSRLGGWFAAGT